MSTRPARFYRDKQNGKIMGVCAGLADYAGVNVLWVRLATVALVLMGMGLIVPAYFAVGLLAAKKPPHLYREGTGRTLGEIQRRQATPTVRDVRAQFRAIDRRLAEVESFYVSSSARLAAQIERLR